MRRLPDDEELVEVMCRYAYEEAMRRLFRKKGDPEAADLLTWNALHQETQDEWRAEMRDALHAIDTYLTGGMDR